MTMAALKPTRDAARDATRDEIKYSGPVPASERLRMQKKEALALLAKIQGSMDALARAEVKTLNSRCDFAERLREIANEIDPRR